MLEVKKKLTVKKESWKWTKKSEVKKKLEVNEKVRSKKKSWK